MSPEYTIQRIKELAEAYMGGEEALDPADQKRRAVDCLTEIIDTARPVLWHEYVGRKGYYPPFA